jgi:Zn ribbon nucleic-acid-binding protein
MKHYHVLECEQQDEISRELFDFLNSPNGPMQVQATEFWNFLNKTQAYECLKSCPSLRDWLSRLKLKAREISFTIYNDKIKTFPHVDEPPVVAKINFPVLNTKDTFNVWFDDKDQEIDRVECVKPIVLRSNVKHTVEIGPHAVFPRLQVSFCFYNEPIGYLE